MNPNLLKTNKPLLIKSPLYGLRPAKCAACGASIENAHQVDKGYCSIKCMKKGLK